MAGLWSAERLLQLDPLHEASYRQLMRLHVDAGERARALRVYHACASTLERELDVLPGSETVELYEQLLTQDTKAPAGRRPEPVASEAPLIGRAAAWELLAACWQDASSRTTLALVTGEAGVGKSRLVGDFRASCSRRGIATAAARAYQAEGGLPYGPIIDLLRSPSIHPTLAKLEPVWRREMARILPELDAEQREAEPIDRPSDSHRSRLFEALARTLTGTGGALLLVIDDLQWAGVDTLEFLHFLVRFPATDQLLVVGTARSEEVDPDHPLTALAAGLDGIGALTQIPLARLQGTDVTTLAQWCLGTAAGEDAVRRVVEESEGNPLFVVELARSGMDAGGQHGSTPVPGGLPPRMQTVIQRRLAQLSNRARDVAGVAAVIGRAFSIDVITRLTRQDGEIVVALDELWRRGIVRERGANGYDFSHDKIREVAYLDLGPARRRQVHLEVADALVELHSGAIDAVAGQIAVHLDRAGAIDGAVGYYQRAIDGAAHVFAHEDVIAFARRALDLLARCPASTERGDRELAILVPLVVAVYSGPVMEHELRDLCERAAALRTERGLLPDASTSRIMANLAIVRRDYVESQRRGEMLVARGEQVDDALLMTEGHYLVGVSAFWRGAFESSRVHLQRSLDAYDPEREAQHLELFGQDPVSVCLVRLAFTLWVLGRIDEADAVRRQAFDRVDALQHRYTQGYVRTLAAWNAVEAGLDEEAERLTVGLRTDGWSSGVEALALSLFPGWAAVRRGDAAGGIQLLEEAVSTARSIGYLMFEPLALLLLARAHDAAGDPAPVSRWRRSHAPSPSRRCSSTKPRATASRASCCTAPTAIPQELEALLRHAVETARRQGAPALEDKARVSLVRWLATADPRRASVEQRHWDELRQRFPALGRTEDSGARQ